MRIKSCDIRVLLTVTLSLFFSRSIRIFGQIWVMKDESYFRDYTKTPWTSLSKPTTNEFKFQMFKIIILDFSPKNHSNFTLIRNYFRSTGSSCFLFSAKKAKNLIMRNPETNLVNGVILIKICKKMISLIIRILHLVTQISKISKISTIWNSSKAKHSNPLK